MKKILPFIIFAFIAQLSFAQDIPILPGSSKDKQYIMISNNGKKLLSNQRLRNQAGKNPAKGYYREYEAQVFVDSVKSQMRAELIDSLNNLNFESENFANTDLTQEGNRIYNVSEDSLVYDSCAVILYNLYSSGVNQGTLQLGNGFNYGANGSFVVATQGMANNITLDAQLNSGAGKIVMSGSTDAMTITPGNSATGGLKFAIAGIPTYADDTAAGAGGLTQGAIYKTAAGALMIKL